MVKTLVDEFAEEVYGRTLMGFRRWQFEADPNRRMWFVGIDVQDGSGGFRIFLERRGLDEFRFVTYDFMPSVLSREDSTPDEIDSVQESWSTRDVSTEELEDLLAKMAMRVS
jgi:hypothetical protein